MKRKLSLLIVALMATSLVGMAHDRKALRINEVMVVNDSGYVDDYGNRGAWIEIFNANFSPIDISSVFLSTNKENPETNLYAVPLGDALTKIGKRQHVLFWADGMPNKGTFHTSFKLIPGQTNWIGLYDADMTLIDSVSVPASLPDNASYAREADGQGKWQIRTGGEKDYITPSSANIIKDTNKKITDFAQKDPNGFGMTVMAMCIVFSALLILCLCFYGIGQLGKYFSRVRKAQAKGIEVAQVDIDDHDSGEEIAAIVMALHQHLNAHDNESTVLTINKVKRAYSPWSSKIYSLRELPRK